MNRREFVALAGASVWALPLQGMDELCDLDKDPYKEANLIDRSDARETLQQVPAELRSMMERTRHIAPTSAVNARYAMCALDERLTHA